MSVVEFGGAQSQSFEAAIEPVSWTVIVAVSVELNTPGARFVSVSAAAHAELTLSVAVTSFEMQAVPLLTWSLIVSVPDAAELDAFVVSALKEPKVPPPPT